jgi:hypothetical protein
MAQYSLEYYVNFVNDERESVSVKDADRDLNGVHVLSYSLSWLIEETHKNLRQYSRDS